MEDLTKAVYECLLILPRNFGIGHLCLTVVEVVERYNEKHPLSDEGKRNAFDNLIMQVLREAFDQDIIVLNDFAQMQTFCLLNAESVEDIRQAMIKAWEHKDEMAIGCCSPKRSKK